jgi:hypothetical protein
MRKGMLLFFLFLLGCAFYVKDSKILQDYTRIGWISDDIFQFQSIGDVSIKSYSLVERRKNSKENAEKKAFLNFVSTLQKLYNLSEIEDNTIQKLKKIYKKYSSLAKEYYIDMDRCVLIYRLYKSDLKSEIEGVLAVLNEQD